MDTHQEKEEETMDKSTSPNPTAGEIWDTLSKVNVNEHTQEKNGLTYLSWAWAWGIMMEHYPQMEVDLGGGEYGGVQYFPGNTAMVTCKVTIGDVSREMFLPVMTGYKNSAVVNPDSRGIGDAKMRCLTKCFALFGLGHYIYAGEDLPREGEPVVNAPGRNAVPSESSGKSEAYQRGLIDTLVAKVKMAGKALVEDGYTVHPDLRDRTLVAIKAQDEEAILGVLSELENMRSQTAEGEPNEGFERI